MTGCKYTYLHAALAADTGTGMGGNFSHLPAFSSSCWFQSKKAIYPKLSQQLKTSSTRKVKIVNQASPCGVKASPELASRSQGFSSDTARGRENGHLHHVPGIPRGTPSRVLPWHLWVTASQQKPQAPAEEEISMHVTPRQYSPSALEVLEAQLCLLVPSPPAKPNPAMY